MSEAKEPSSWKCESDVLEYINGTPALLSLLYDLDLLPEQVTEGRDKFAMLSTATHFKSAIDAALADQSREIALLKEQIRVADVAYQGLFERSKEKDQRIATLESLAEDLRESLANNL